MKRFMTAFFAIAFLVLATVFAPEVVEAGRRVVTKTVVRYEGAPSARTARRYERSYASDCAGTMSASTCAGFSASASDCDMSMQSSCSGPVSSSRRRTTMQVYIR